MILLMLVSCMAASILHMAFKSFFASSSASPPNAVEQQSTERQQPSSNVQHDLLAVKALGMSSSRAAAARSPLNRNNEINMALKGVEKADQYSREGKLEQSLKLYQSSLEILIKAISTTSPNNTSNISPEYTKQIKDRIKIALTEAEKVKAKLPSQKQPVGLKDNELRARPVRKPLPPSSNSAKAAATNANDDFTQLIFSDMFVDSAAITTKWSDVAGLKRAKQALQEAAILPLLRPDLFTNLRSPPTTVLLYGPPGVGKTMIVKAVAHESQCSLFSCGPSSLTSKWLGESEKLLRTLFQVAGAYAPSIIFVDEIDSLLSKRKENEHEASRRFKTEFMIQMDGIKNNSSNGVLVIGCTNCPWDIDDAIIRRFQRRIYIPLPDVDTRKAVLQSILNKCKPHSLSKQQLIQLVNITEGYSCSDLTSVGSEAAFGPLRSLGGIQEISKVKQKDVRPINYDDFLSALQSNPRSVSRGLLQRYSQWENEATGGNENALR